MFSSLSDLREMNSNGRDQYIIQHPKAITLGNCHELLAQHAPEPSGHISAAYRTERGWRWTEAEGGIVKIIKNVKIFNKGLVKL